MAIQEPSIFRKYFEPTFMFEDALFNALDPHPQGRDKSKSVPVTGAKTPKELNEPKEMTQDTSTKNPFIKEAQEAIKKSFEPKGNTPEVVGQHPEFAKFFDDLRFKPKEYLSETKMQEIAAQMAKLVAEKNRAYGNSAINSTEIIKILYPKGVSPVQYQDFLLIIRVIDKLTRIATANDALGESPWRDILGYALIAVTHDES